MTPTERAAVAEAIAALEEAQGYVRKYIKREYGTPKWAAQKCDIRVASAVTSLRARASAPSETVGRGEDK